MLKLSVEKPYLEVCFLLNINIYIKFGVKKQDIITISEEKNNYFKAIKTYLERLWMFLYGQYVFL